MFDDNKIRERVPISAFLEKIKKIKPEHIECTKHTFFRLSQKQRTIYESGELARIIQKESPFLAGIQYNGCYAVFYKYKDKILKLIVALNAPKINIVTFYFIKEDQVPRL